MLISKIHQFLTATTEKKSLTKFWFALSMTFGLIYALLALKRAFISPYAVQDDARQHTGVQVGWPTLDRWLAQILAVATGIDHLVHSVF